MSSQQSLQNLLREFDHNELKWKFVAHGADPLEQLFPYLENPRTHSQALQWIWKQLQQNQEPGLLRRLRNVYNQWLGKTPRDRLNHYPLPTRTIAEELIVGYSQLAKLLYGVLHASLWNDEWTQLLRQSFPNSHSLPDYLKEAIAHSWDQIGNVDLLQQLWSSSNPPPALLEAIERFLQKHPARLPEFRAYLPPEKTVTLLWSTGADKQLQEFLAQKPNHVKELVERCCLAIDIESDGNEIREIGVFWQGRKRRLHPDADLKTAVAELQTLCDQASLIVGHNCLYWDLPILRHHGLTLNPRKVWDTLHVSFLLSPSSPTHILGGRHRATDDAKLAFKRFLDQAKALPPEVLIRLLRHTKEGSRDLHAHLCTSLTPQGKPAALPCKLSDLPPLVLLTPAECPRWWWRSGFSWWAETGERRFRPLDLSILLTRLADLDTPGAHVLSAVLRWAKAHKVSVCPAMIPTWLTEPDKRLTEIIEATPTARSKSGLQVSPIPTYHSLGRHLPSPCTVAGTVDIPVWLETDSDPPSQSEHPKTLTVRSA